jgi:hypothetical protein
MNAKIRLGVNFAMKQNGSVRYDRANSVGSGQRLQQRK